MFDGIRHCGHIPGHYLIHSFVVGSRVDSSVTLEKTLKAADGVWGNWVISKQYNPAMLAEAASKSYSARMTIHRLRR